VRIAVDLGSVNEVSARRFAPKATITAVKTRDDAILALQAGRADADVLAAMLGITAVAKNPALGSYRILTNPTVALPATSACAASPIRASARCWTRGSK